MDIGTLRESMSDTNWRDYSKCAGLNTEYFFDFYEYDPMIANVIDSLCATCPVKDFCLEEGVKGKEWGVWGGMFLVNGKLSGMRSQHKNAAQLRQAQDRVQEVSDGLD